MRIHWALAVAFCLVVGPPLTTRARAEQPRRNIVLIVTDDQSPTAGCYGDRTIKTPNLDALAAEGTRFDLAFSTVASCSPSRAVILTGLYAHATGQYGLEHHFHHFRGYETLQSLPVLLSKLGYRTARIGKFHVSPEAAYRFDDVLEGDDRDATQMAEQCRPVIRATSERPFFLYFCTSDPHRSNGPASELPGNPNRFGNPPPRKATARDGETRYDPADVTVPSFLPDTPVCRAELAQYYQSISRIDRGLGRLVEILKEAHVYDDTLIVYTSDHGMAFPGAKTTLYDPGMRVPLVVRSPGAARAGVASRAMVSLVDLTPTLLDFAGGLDADGGLRDDLAPALVKQGAIGGAKNLDRHQGRSFLAALGREEAAGFDEVYGSHTFHEVQMYYPMRVVRTRRYKLIWNIAHPLPFPFAADLWEAPTWQDRYRLGPQTLYGRRTIEAYVHRPQFELYDLASDPDEIHNLADDPRQAETLGELKEKLRTFQRRTWDGWQSKWDYE